MAEGQPLLSSMYAVFCLVLIIIAPLVQIQAFQVPHFFLRPRVQIHSVVSRLDGSFSWQLHALLSQDDETYLLQAVDCAKKGLGHTFPNPAVGCVLVQQGKGVIGQGFHPRAGFPHAEVFALLEAAGHVPDGVAAALSVVNDQKDIDSIRELTEKYGSPGGPTELFGDLFTSTSNPVTAYVTLEPCCHTGKTPPCAVSLALAQVDRVVVGFRDPNPRVDGGGVKLLVDNGVAVDLAVDHSQKLEKACQDLVIDFCKRITPRPEWPSDSYNDRVTGSMRRILRSRAARGKKDGNLPQIIWGGGRVDAADNETLNAAIEKLSIKPEWMEHLDAVLWKNELVLLRLNKAVANKKGAKLLGNRIAQQLQAHVVQTVGHTVLLYRPGIPPVMDLTALVEEARSSS